MRFLYQLIELIKPRLLTVNFTVKTAVSVVITSVVAIQVTIQATVVKYKTHLITNCWNLIKNDSNWCENSIKFKLNNFLIKIT